MPYNDTKYQNLEAYLSAIGKAVFVNFYYMAYKQHKKVLNDATMYVVAFCDEHNIVYHIQNDTLTD